MMHDLATQVKADDVLDEAVFSDVRSERVGSVGGGGECR